MCFLQSVCDNSVCERAQSASVHGSWKQQWGPAAVARLTPAPGHTGLKSIVISYHLSDCSKLSDYLISSLCRKQFGRKRRQTLMLVKSNLTSFLFWPNTLTLWGFCKAIRIFRRRMIIVKWMWWTNTLRTSLPLVVLFCFVLSFVLINSHFAHKTRKHNLSKSRILQNNLNQYMTKLCCLFFISSFCLISSFVSLFSPFHELLWGSCPLSAPHLEAGSTCKLTITVSQWGN